MGRDLLNDSHIASSKDTREIWVAGILPGLVFGSLHFTAWDYSFPTSAESIALNICPRVPGVLLPLRFGFHSAALSTVDVFNSQKASLGAQKSRFAYPTVRCMPAGNHHSRLCEPAIFAVRYLSDHQLDSKSTAHLAPHGSRIDKIPFILFQS